MTWCPGRSLIACSQPSSSVKNGWFGVVSRSRPRMRTSMICAGRMVIRRLGVAPEDWAGRIVIAPAADDVAGANRLDGFQNLLFAILGQHQLPARKHACCTTAEFRLGRVAGNRQTQVGRLIEEATALDVIEGRPVGGGVKIVFGGGRRLREAEGRCRRVRIGSWCCSRRHRCSSLG